MLGQFYQRGWTPPKMEMSDWLALAGFDLFCKKITGILSPDELLQVVQPIVFSEQKSNITK